MPTASQLRAEAFLREKRLNWPHKDPFYDRLPHMIDYQRGYAAALRAVADKIAGVKS